MKRINSCQACNFLIAGVKTRIAIPHTCQKSKEEIMALRTKVLDQNNRFKLAKLKEQNKEK